jgi:hypothetical protein
LGGFFLFPKGEVITTSIVSSGRRECLIVVGTQITDLIWFFSSGPGILSPFNYTVAPTDLISHGRHVLETLAYPDRLFESEHYARTLPIRTIWLELHTDAMMAT